MLRHRVDGRLSEGKRGGLRSAAAFASAGPGAEFEVVFVGVDGARCREPLLLCCTVPFEHVPLLDRWRAFDAPRLVALVRAGATFVNGHLVERPSEAAA
jgi:hypothetical protein